MTTTAFYTRRLAHVARSALARRGRVVRGWLLVLPTVIAAAPAPIPLPLQLIPGRGLS
jgi:hypothetical protein